MKRNLIYSVFAAILLASCSSDDIPAPAPAPETLDAYISLGITNGTVKTKADSEDTSYGDGDKEDDNGNLINQGDPAGTTAINSFTVAIFRGAPSAVAAADGIVAPVTASEGTLLYLNTFDLQEKNAIVSDNDASNKLCVSNVVKSENNYQINGIKIKGGNIHVLIMANMPADIFKDKTSITMAEMRTLVYGNLAGEGFNNEKASYPCSMSSKWLEYDVTPTNNGDVFYLFDKEATPAKQANTETDDKKREFNEGSGDAIPLYRNVSAVGFQNIILAPSAGWGAKGGATLTLKSVFVANAIGSTSLTAGEVPGKDYIFNSGYSGKETVVDGTKDDTNGALAANNTKMLNLNCDNFGEVTNLIAGGKAPSSVSYYSDTSDGHISVGKYFMVYENSKEMALKLQKPDGSDKKTLLILCADYKYTDDLGFEHTLENRHYAVVVNEANSTNEIKGDGANQLVQRNYIYKINLTIVGPGSINPYDPLYTANATAFVEAAPWEGVINIDQDAE